MNVGDTFEGGYRIVGELGRGSSSTVYLGEHVEIGQRVAIKLMDAPSERVTREGRVLAKLSSPHTVRLLAFGRTAHAEQYMIFEWVDGEPLNDYLKRNAPVHWEQVREIARQVLLSLAEAHAQNITHRDIKPGNLMVGPNLDVKVLDFGVAKLHDAPSITAANQVPGTPRYMAPEVLRAGDVTPAADIFALGTIAHELLTGQHPNPHRDLADIIDQQLDDKPYRLPRNVDAPAAARVWFERMMSKDTSWRFADANEALTAMPEVDESTHEQTAVRAAMPPSRAAQSTARDDATQLAELIDTGNRAQPEPVHRPPTDTADEAQTDDVKPTAGPDKNRPPSKFLWPTMALDKVDDGDNWSVTVLLGGLLLFATLVLAGLYQAGAFDPPRVKTQRVNRLVPDEPILVPDAGIDPELVSGALKGISHFDRGEYVEALKEFQKIERGNDPIQREQIGNYPQRALDAIADQAMKDAEEAETLEEIEAAAHDPQIAQSLYRGDERINAVVEKLRLMGRQAEEDIAKEKREQREQKHRKKR